MSWWAVGMAVAGLAKSELIDRPAAEKQRKLAAKTQELSPWTGMEAAPVKEADPFGSGLQFGATGAAIGSAKAAAAADKALADRLNTGGSVVGYGKTMEKVPSLDSGLSKENPNFPGSPLRSSWWRR